MAGLNRSLFLPSCCCVWIICSSQGRQGTPSIRGNDRQTIGDHERDHCRNTRGEDVRLGMELHRIGRTNKKVGIRVRPQSHGVASRYNLALKKGVRLLHEKVGDTRQ